MTRNKPKTQIVFNEGDRAKYLLGFRKRKMERKVKAREDLDLKIKAERQRQRELKYESMLDEGKGKLKVPTFENKLTKSQVIEMPNHTITVSDLSDSMKFNKFTDDEEDLDESVAKDAVITKSKAKISKECAMIEDRLAKLEKQKKVLENCKSKTKMKKLLRKSRQSSKGVKATKKHQIKETKIKVKTKAKLKKRLDKKQK